MRKYEIEITEETAKALEEFTAVLNHKLHKKESEQRTPEDMIKAALAYYLKLVKPSLQGDHDIAKISSLATGYPLKNRFSEYLSKLPYSLSVIAERIGVSKGTLSGILNNKHQASLDVFLRLYFLIGSPPLDELFYRDIPE